MLACICCGAIEVPLGIMILSAIGWLGHKIKRWKCCCGCHKEHEKTKVPPIPPKTP